MLNKRPRAFLAVFAVLVCLISLPVAASLHLKISAVSLLKSPLAVSSKLAVFLNDLFCFEKNARENKILKTRLAELQNFQFERDEMALENARLVKLLNLKTGLSHALSKSLYARVIGRSLLSWNRVLLVDRGRRDGVFSSRFVLAESSLIGKVMEAGPSVSKVVLITDPNSRIGALVQRSRYQGILFGTPKGECRLKYLPLEAEIKTGDVVETAGFGGFFPKGIRVGVVERAWREPGQIYQVASVKPFVDLTRVEEVLILDSST